MFACQKVNGHFKYRDTSCCYKFHALSFCIVRTAKRGEKNISDDGFIDTRVPPPNSCIAVSRSGAVCVVSKPM